MPGLGTSFGRGGATSYVQDLQNADCILIEGSNFAEAHPVAFRFVMKAKERGATVIHVDPRFTRTSALADVYVALRSGSDIAFLGGIVNWILTRERYFREYVLAYTNASYLVGASYRDTEDLAGLFSGYDEDARAYDPTTWDFERDASGAPVRDATLTHPRCVLEVVRRHFARYTPEMVERVCGVPQAQFELVCETLARNSGRDRTTAFAYAVGWTQHTVGVQYIRTAAILQLLLGNVGRPGGGIMALRGHANIQGATDIPTLYDLLPGYLQMPSALRDEQSLDAYLRSNARPSGWWTHLPAYMVSLLKAYWGDAATAENDFRFDYLPQIAGDHSTLPTQVAAADGKLRGAFVIGQNPASSGQNAAMIYAGFERLEWMVNVDAYETETASFWKRDGVDPAAIATECFFIPSATILEKSGTMVNTNRLLQWHDRAIEPVGESISDLRFVHDLGRRLRALYAGSEDPKDRPLLDLTWDYGDDEPDPLRVLREINGYDTRTGEQLDSFVRLRDDGSTAAGAWIYTGVCPDAITNRARARDGDDAAALGWGFAWPANRRMLYNRASADPDGAPWSARKAYVWWDDASASWTGVDVPDLVPEAKPHTGDEPFLMQTDGLGALFVPGGALKDGPLPAHYEPSASPVGNAIYPRQSNPTARHWDRPDNPVAAEGSAQYPHILTTYRITEMSGIMTRYIPWLAELQPTAFCEIDPQLAVESGIVSGDTVTVATPLGEMECKALVSGRMRPLRVGGKRVHTVGIPYNYGALGFARGATPGALIPLVADPNVTIHEAKSLTCAIRKGGRA